MSLYVVIGVLSVLLVLYVALSVRANNAARKAQAERNRLYRNCFLNGLAGLLAKMVTADGAVAESETAVAEKLFRDMGLGAGDLEHTLAAFRDGCRNTLPGAYYASLFAPYATNESRYLVYEVLWDIAAADGAFAAGEERFLRDLLSWLDLDAGQYDRNLAAHARRFDSTAAAVAAASERLTTCLNG